MVMPSGAVNSTGCENPSEGSGPALHGGAVTDADQLELALEAFGHALHHVGDDRAQGAGERASSLADNRALPSSI